MADGYPRYPAIGGDRVVFVAEDDLWSVSADGGAARRLTAGAAAAKCPRFSPDGGLIAFTGAEEGPNEVYVIPAEGGQSRRLTYEGAVLCRVAGWDATGDSVVYASDTAGAHLGGLRLRRVSRHGGESTELPYGWALSLSRGPGGVTVLGRDYLRDPAYWKRYRGGAAGQLWIDGAGDGEFRRLIDLAGNPSNPHIIGSRVFFLSDHEGHGNVYSVDFSGGDLRRHTDHDDFYARGLSGDGARLVYHCGGALYLLDPADDGPRRLRVDMGVTRTRRARRFVDAAEYLDSVNVAPDGDRLAVTARGKMFTFANWAGPVTQHGSADGVRYRLATWLSDGKRLVAVAADNRPDEALVCLAADGTAPQVRLDHLDIGRVHEIAASPTAALVAVANHRHELLLIDLDARPATATILDTGDHGEMTGLAFAPDGRWLAYACPEVSDTNNIGRSAVKLAELDTGRTAVVTRRILHDFSPSFDPGGKYLYFIGQREFNPVYDALHMDLGFPKGARPYAIALGADTQMPFRPGAGAGRPPFTDSGGAARVRVDLDGIGDRIVPLPVDEDKYVRVLGGQGKVLVLSHPVQPRIRQHELPDSPHGVLDAVDLATGEVARIADQMMRPAVTADGTTLVYRANGRVRVIPATTPAPESAATGSASGWIDLDRVKVSVRPDTEWPQMFREAWRLVREQFWAADMSGVDWSGAYDRYAPLVDRVSTRGELSDLIWDMYGELGSSHLYEALGDYPARPRYRQGYLGADFEYTPAGCRIAAIGTGDPWHAPAASPLRSIGVDARVGDAVLAINGQPVDARTTIAQRLVNLADQDVTVTLRRGDAEPHTAVVRTLGDEQPMRYRDWVDGNRTAVHEATGGRVGYLHVPDMYQVGFGEFHRGFLAECDRRALIVDVRYNSGGHISQLLLEKLARRHVGGFMPRRGQPHPYPRQGPRGPLVGLTNEYAGSDGDVFSQAFTLLGLGPLVGTRTWGGVIYTRPWRPRLVDNTRLVQGEMAVHFDDVGWSVENHGAVPDIDVVVTPQDYAAGRDPQLAVAIETALSELEKHPGFEIDPKPRPRLAAPPLPPRPQPANE